MTGYGVPNIKWFKEVWGEFYHLKPEDKVYSEYEFDWGLGRWLWTGGFKIIRGDKNGS